jgi:hypothetical protein
MKIRVKKRHGRLHRLCLLSSNKVKGSTLNPIYKEEFHIRVDPKTVNKAAIPLGDTENITAILDEVKEKVSHHMQCLR